MRRELSQTQRVSGVAGGAQMWVGPHRGQEGVQSKGVPGDPGVGMLSGWHCPLLSGRVTSDDPRPSQTSRLDTQTQQQVPLALLPNTSGSQEHRLPPLPACTFRKQIGSYYSFACSGFACTENQPQNLYHAPQPQVTLCEHISDTPMKALLPSFCLEGYW